MACRNDPTPLSLVLLTVRVLGTVRSSSFSQRGEKAGLRCGFLASRRRDLKKERATDWSQEIEFMECLYVLSGTNT
jgi:hypothetical protein